MVILVQRTREFSLYGVVAVVRGISVPVAQIPR